MSDNIPFEIQMEIIKRLPVKPLIQFRSVSKSWKSLIDSSDFIKGYGARHTQPRSRILRISPPSNQDDLTYICLVEDDIETFKVQQELAPAVVSPFLKQYLYSSIVGVCHGLLCFHGYNEVYHKYMLVIWNPSIGKSFGIVVPSFCNQVETVYGFGVCPVTGDPTIVKVECTDHMPDYMLVNMPWRVEVFTLSSGVWNVIPSDNLPNQSIRLDNSTQVVIDRFIYWGARDKTFADQMVVSFDLITKEFKVVDLPDTLKNELYLPLSVSKLRGSLVVYKSMYVDGAEWRHVWVMEHDSSFRKLFTIGAPVENILGFKKNGETVFETRKEDGIFTTLDVYDPCSQQIKNLGISGVRGSFFMGSYKESLLLLNHSDLHIYSNNN